MTNRRSGTGGVGAVALAALVLAGGAPVLAAEGRALAISLGGFDVSKNAVVEAGLEYRMASRAWGLVPALGLSATEEESVWVYGGLRRPFRVGGPWRLTPGFAVALYEEGEGKDLGGPLEFRTSVELARRFADGSTLGVTLYHLSNASTEEPNPGSNSLVVSYSYPVSF